MDPPSPELVEQINKRFTLNLLIQGSASHAFLTAHHLVKAELDAIDARLVPLYDKEVVEGFLNYWHGDLVLVVGRSQKFWNGISRPSNPFHRHGLLVRYGNELQEATRQRLLARAREKGVTSIRGLRYARAVGHLVRTVRYERDHKPELAALAKQAASEIWGIDPGRLRAELTRAVSFGDIPQPSTISGAMLRGAAAGYSGVIRSGSELVVMAKAWIWPLLAHELVKGTAELVCLHGLNKLADEVYAPVVAEADKIEYEIRLMQAGAELWKRLLAAMPPGAVISEMLMRLAMLEPEKLDQAMEAVILSPDAGRRAIERL